MRRWRTAVVAGGVLLVLVVACFGARWLAPYRANDQHLLLGPQGPSWRHWFGTDELGRDQLSEILYAGRVTLEIGLAVAVLSTVVGTVIGAVAGYAGRWADQVLMRLTDLFLVLPTIAVLAIALKRYGHSNLAIVLVLASIGWMYIARIVRAQVLTLRELEYVDAARASGASPVRILVRHILPNSIGPIVVHATLAVAAAVVAESTLSYLGFGVQRPATSWGRMIADARGTVGTHRSYLLWFPGLVLFVTVLAVNYLGDGLRSAFDPKARR